MKNNEKRHHWDNAPEWAMYRATDQDGDRYYHEYEPKIFGDYWINTGRSQRTGKSIDNWGRPDHWRNTLERRPGTDSEPVVDDPLRYKGFDDTKWDDAPDWAMYRAVDLSGLAFWFEHEPVLGLLGWDRNVIKSQAMLAGAGFDTTNWKNSLQCRPVTHEWLKSLGFDVFEAAYMLKSDNGYEIVVSSDMQNVVVCLRGPNHQYHRMPLHRPKDGVLGRDRVMSIVSFFLN